MTAPVRRREKRQEVMQRNTSEGARPGDGFLAEVSRRAALTAHQQKAGEETMVGRAAAGWRARAACRTSDPEIFFPVAENCTAYDEAVAAAKRVCARCPVQAECRVWAIYALPHGVAGGMDEDERHQARRAGRAPRVPACRSVASREVAAEAQRLPARHRAPVIKAGKAALAQGADRDRVASEFGVTRRTVDRWAADARRTSALLGGDR